MTANTPHGKIKAWGELARMIDLLKKAELFAEKAHKGQFDKAGVPYIEHPKAVAAMVDDDMGKAVAYLHDVVEDTEVSIDDIRKEFGNKVADAVDVLTRKKGVSYMDYIRGINSNSLAVKVKRADLTHNMNLSRLSVISDEDIKRVKKYQKAYKILSE